MKILVTGAKGMVGTALCNNLKNIRDGKNRFSDVTIYEEEGNKLLGISIVSLLDIETDNNIEITSKASESGPSGGLMTTLSIYNALTKEDLTGGKRIVGTGTIDRDGNIGKIGGVNYKIASAIVGGNLID